jgi:hypothetical protein
MCRRSPWKRGHLVTEQINGEIRYIPINDGRNVIATIPVVPRREDVAIAYADHIAALPLMERIASSLSDWIERDAMPTSPATLVYGGEESFADAVHMAITSSLGIPPDPDSDEPARCPEIMPQPSKAADIQHEIYLALLKHTREGVEMLAAAIRIIPSDSHDVNAQRVAEVIAASLAQRL